MKYKKLRRRRGQGGGEWYQYEAYRGVGEDGWGEGWGGEGEGVEGEGVVGLKDVVTRRDFTNQMRSP